MSKFLDTKREVSTNVGESQAFSIQASAKAFKVLIDGLYANKPVSITRELWANAYDAHVAAGAEDVPFEVVVPSRWDPRFFVRDFGTSMTHHEIMNMYSTVFQSTKADDSSAVGAFGLGSKSPFSYTDTFTVTAYLDGVVRQYAAVVNGEGIPTINFLGEDTTEEKNGIAVSFPIAAQDVNTFVEAQKSVALGHDVKPTTADNTQFPAVNVVRKGNGWTTFKPSSYHSPGLSAGIYARMGCVIYPIDLSAVPTLSTNLRNENVIFDFNINEVAVTASREALSYGRNEPTEKAVVAKVNAYISELVSGLKNDLKAAKTMWDKRLLAKSLMSGVGYSGVAHDAMCKLNKNLFGRKDAKIILKDTYTQSTVATSVTDSQGKVQKGSKIINELALSCQSMSIGTRDKVYAYPSANYSVSPSSSFAVVVQDMSDSEQRRTGYRISLLNISEVMWVRMYPNVKGSKEALDAVLKVFDGANIITANKLPPIPKDATTGKTISPYTPTMATVIKYKEGKRTTYAKRKVTAEEAKEGGYIIPTYRGRLVDCKYGATENMSKLTQGAMDHKLLPTTCTVIVVPATLSKRFSGDQWENLITKMKKVTFDEKVVSEAAYKKKLANSYNLEGIASFVAKLSKKNGLTPKVQSIMKLTKIEEQQYGLARMMNTVLNQDMPASMKGKPAEDVYKELLTGYPMLNFVQIRGSSPVNTLDTAADYVYMMDTYNKSNTVTN